MVGRGGVHARVGRAERAYGKERRVGWEVTRGPGAMAGMRGGSWAWGMGTEGCAAKGPARGGRGQTTQGLGTWGWWGCTPSGDGGGRGGGGGGGCKSKVVGGAVTAKAKGMLLADLSVGLTFAGRSISGALEPLKSTFLSPLSAGCLLGTDPGCRFPLLPSSPSLPCPRPPTSTAPRSPRSRATASAMSARR